MHAFRWLVVAAALAAAGAQADEFRFLGHFDDVTSGDGGEHCAGYGLGLWRHDDRLLGLFDVHQGLCGDPPCAVLREAALDPATGRLTFAAVVRDEQFAFHGQLSHAGVVGLLNGAPVRLAPDASGTHQDFVPDRSFAAWCGFWQTVHRCTGVRELCGAAAPRN